MTRLIEVRVPDMGNFNDVSVIDVLVKPGDAVEVETPLATLETEKATMDVPSTAAGVVDKVHIAKGDRISTGGLVVTVRAEGEGAQAAAKPAAAPVPAPAPAPTPAPAAPPTAPTASSAAPIAAAATPAAPAAPAVQAVPGVGGQLPPINEAGFSRAHASPSVRRFARELGVDLTRVQGSGFKGRITQEDVKSFVKRALAGGAPAAGQGGALPSVPVVDFSQFGPTETQPLSRIQRISGPRLHASWVNIPHVTQFDEADITDLENVRTQLKDQAAQSGIKLTPLAFIMRACVKALREFPQFNASLDPTGQNLVLKKYIHIGFAADTPNGLVVPVIRDVDRKDVYRIARELAELSEKARAGKLSGAEMQGGSFTISSLGGIGGTAFTPIINAPEVAILGVSKSTMKPVYMGQSFVPRLMLPLSLSYDHRVIDGANAARFTTFLSRVLSDARGLLEAVP